MVVLSCIIYIPKWSHSNVHSPPARSGSSNTESVQATLANSLSYVRWAVACPVGADILGAEVGRFLYSCDMLGCVRPLLALWVVLFGKICSSLCVDFEEYFPM